MITDPLLLPHICPIHSRRCYITNEENINYNTGSPHANLLQRDYCSMIGMFKWLKATSLSILICASVHDEQLALCEAAYLDAPCHLNNNPFKYKESIALLLSDHFLWALVLLLQDSKTATAHQTTHHFEINIPIAVQRGTCFEYLQHRVHKVAKSQLHVFRLILPSGWHTSNYC